MNAEKVLGLVEEYRRLFLARNITALEYPHEDLLVDKVRGLQYCHNMLDRIIPLVQEGRMEKAMRWLGFIQGVLWATGTLTVMELKQHNRPETEDGTT